MAETDSNARPGETAYAPMVKLVERVDLLEARIAELEGGPRAKH